MKWKKFEVKCLGKVSSSYFHVGLLMLFEVGSEGFGLRRESREQEGEGEQNSHTTTLPENIRIRRRRRKPGINLISEIISVKCFKYPQK